MTPSPVIVRADLDLPIVIAPHKGAPMVIMVPTMMTDAQVEALVDQYARGVA